MGHPSITRKEREREPSFMPLWHRRCNVNTLSLLPPPFLQSPLRINEASTELRNKPRWIGLTHVLNWEEFMEYGTTRREREMSTRKLTRRTKTGGGGGGREIPMHAVRDESSGGRRYRHRRDQFGRRTGEEEDDMSIDITVPISGRGRVGWEERRRRMYRTGQDSDSLP